MLSWILGSIAAAAESVETDKSCPLSAIIYAAVTRQYHHKLSQRGGIITGMGACVSVCALPCMHMLVGSTGHVTSPPLPCLVLQSPLGSVRGYLPV